MDNINNQADKVVNRIESGLQQLMSPLLTHLAKRYIPENERIAIIDKHISDNIAKHTSDSAESALNVAICMIAHSTLMHQVVANNLDGMSGFEFGELTQNMTPLMIKAMTRIGYKYSHAKSELQLFKKKVDEFHQTILKSNLTVGECRKLHDELIVSCRKGIEMLHLNSEEELSEKEISSLVSSFMQEMTRGSEMFFIMSTNLPEDHKINKKG